MTTSMQSFHRYGVPLLGGLFLAVAFVLFAVLFVKGPVGRGVEGKQNTARLALYAMLVFQFFVGCFLLLSVVATSALTFALVPFVALWGLRHVERGFLLAGALTQAWLLWQIVGVVGPSGLYDALRNGTPGACVAIFGVDDLCKPGWAVFLSFLVLWEQFFATLLVPALVYFATVAPSNFGDSVSRSGESYNEVITSKSASATDPLLP